MRFQKAIRICIVAILLCGFGWVAWLFIDHARAANRAPDGWRQLRVGMSTQDVAALLGYPHTRSIMTFGPNPFGRVFPPREDWYYAFGATGQAMYHGRYVVTFTTGTV